MQNGIPIISPKAMAMRTDLHVIDRRALCSIGCSNEARVHGSVAGLGTCGEIVALICWMST